MKKFLAVILTCMLVLSMVAYENTTENNEIQRSQN